MFSDNNISDVLLYCHDRRIIQGAMTYEMHLVTKLSRKMNGLSERPLWYWSRVAKVSASKRLMSYTSELDFLANTFIER